MNDDVIWRNDGQSPHMIAPAADAPQLRASVTVDAWVRIETGRSEGLQPLVSQWTPRADFDAFSAFDAGTIDGLVTKGFYGAVFDGRYVYYCPTRSHEERTSFHAHVLRYDTHNLFDDPASYAAYDAGETDGLRTAGFYGAIFDGRYIHFIPRDDGVAHHSRFLRFDTEGEFKDPDRWSVFNGTTVGLGPCVGAVFDGRFLYFVAFGHGRVVRFDTTGDFEDREAWSAMDAAAAHEFEPAGWKGGFFDGRFVYFTPFRGEVSVGSSRSPFHGNVLRYDSAGSFEDADNWAVRDAGFTDWLYTMAFTAGASDGRMHGRILRYDRESGRIQPKSV